jgi:ParB family chromosome partitioning protein
MQSLVIQELPPGSLHPNKWNTNIVSPENEAKIDASIKRFGFFKPVIVRELEDASLEIIGGEHRWGSSIRLALKTIPVMNLGRITDEKAKAIGVIDNGRYGADDTLGLAELLESIGTMEEIASFMPFSDSDLSSIFSSSSIALDDLDLDMDDSAPSKAPEKIAQTHQIMRFKVPTGDVAAVTGLIERVMKTQRFKDEDSLSNAGNALVHLCNLSKDLA